MPIHSPQTPIYKGGQRVSDGDHKYMLTVTVRMALYANDNWDVLKKLNAGTFLFQSNDIYQMLDFTNVDVESIDNIDEVEF